MELPERLAEIRLYIEKEPIKVPIYENTTAEDVCTEIAKTLRIGPICRHLFSLQIQTPKTWLYPNFKILDAKSDVVFEYRLRFKVPKLSRLKQTDLGAFNYYYHQVRKDIMDNLVPDISYEKHKGELLGLGVTDMYRIMVEQGLTVEQIEPDYKKYIPKQVLKHHFLFIKPKIHTSLSKIKIRRGQDAWFVKEEYLNSFDKIAPNYLSESYSAQIDENGAVKLILIEVNPFAKEEPGIKYKCEGKDEWLYLCSIEDLCYISARQDGTVEICRKNGIPSYFRFSSSSVMYSFVSLLDGYYRFLYKWTFNLCKDVFTPSLKVLHNLKCHGPVGGHFSYLKLEEKRSNKPGTFILRESETLYNVFYLDVCTQQSSKPKTFKIEKLSKEDYLFSYDEKHYPSMTALIGAYRNTDKSLELLECLPPSEFDKSQLLICALDLPIEKGSNLSQNSQDNILSNSPVIINAKNLQVFKGIKKESRSGLIYHYRCILKHQSGKSEASMKVLKPECRELHLSKFLDLMGSWACLQSNSIVKLFGVTLRGNVSMVSEYLPYGPFDAYLRNKRTLMKDVDLVEAGTYVASALWHLEECGIVHGNIRCRKLLVSAHNENTCLVKLCDPGLHIFTDEDVHWIPPEYYHNFQLAKTASSADVWAFGTTLWEIFSYGASPDPSLDQKQYLSMKRLSLPAGCPLDIYRLILECWDVDVYRRKKPQAIMRDINQILYQVFNSRRTHSYATAFPKAFKNEDQHSITESNTSLLSGATAETYLISDTITEDLMSSSPDLSSTCRFDYTKFGNLLLKGLSEAYSTQIVSPNISYFLEELQSSVCSSWDGDASFQTVLEFGKNCNLVLQGKIGQGFYGEVFKAALQRSDRESQIVAVKKLKASTELDTTTLNDLKREITIMEGLKHKNIVEIIGALPEPEIGLVMEYVQHGSLQTYLKTNKETLKPDSLLKFALDVANGMDYLGEKNIVHRDLAARNILVADENHVKISDFGLARVVGQNNYYILKTNRELPIKWYAPESLRDGRFSHHSDVWSYGVTLYEMFSFGEDPKLPCCTDDMDQSQLLAALEKGARLPCPPTCPQIIYVRVMVPCWKINSKERPTFSMIFEAIQKINYQF